MCYWLHLEYRLSDYQLSEREKKLLSLMWQVFNYSAIAEERSSVIKTVRTPCKAHLQKTVRSQQG